MEMSQLTAFENDELLSRDLGLFANELGLNSDRIATLRTTFARRSHECRILFAILSQ